MLCDFLDLLGHLGNLPGRRDELADGGGNIADAVLNLADFFHEMADLVFTVISLAHAELCQVRDITGGLRHRCHTDREFFNRSGSGGGGFRLHSGGSGYLLSR